MSSFLKVWSTILIMLCALNTISVNGNSLSIAPTENDQRLSSEASLFSSSFGLTENQSVCTEDSALFQQMANANEKDHGNDCGDRHLAHHECHVGHCAFTFLSSWSLDHHNNLDNFTPFSQSDLTEVQLSGPRKPPRA